MVDRRLFPGFNYYNSHTYVISYIIKHHEFTIPPITRLKT